MDYEVFIIKVCVLYAYHAVVAKTKFEFLQNSYIISSKDKPSKDKPSKDKPIELYII